MRAIWAVFEGILDTRDYGLVLYNYSEPTPKKKDKMVDVPGGDGEIDLAPSLGRIVYENREVRLYLFDNRDFETRKAAEDQVVNLLHGQEASLSISDQPGYTFQGTWSVEIEEKTFGKTEYTIVGNCRPYKLYEDVLFYVNAAGGVDLILPSGRKEVSPIFETKVGAEVSFEGITYQIPPGTYRVRDIWLKQGNNELYIDTTPNGGTVSWQDLRDEEITWEILKTKRLSDWRWGGDKPQVGYTWQELRDDGITWGDLKTKRMYEWRYPVDEDDDYIAYIMYERKDL